MKRRKATKKLELSYDPTICSCGSGLKCRTMVDGHGIYLTHVCDRCEQRRTERYRPDIFERYPTDEPIDED
jgi:hypothetical protein